MAPSFLSKLVKSTPSIHSRESSRSFESTRGRSPSPAPSKSSISSNTYSTTPSTIASTTNTEITAVPSIIISGHSPREIHNTSRSSSASNGQPTVTIIPPSPRSASRSGWSNTSSEESSRIGYDSDRQTDASQEPTTAQRRPSFSSKPPSLVTTDTQTPTSTRSPEPRMSNNTLPLTGTQSRTLTPASSTGNLRELVQQHAAASPSASPSAPTLELPGFIPRKKSNKAIKVPPPIDVPNHARAATSPKPSRNSQETVSADSSTYVPVVDSPTSLDSPNPLADTPGLPSASLSTATLQSSRPANPDATSIGSPVTQPTLGVTNVPKKKRSWRSPSRKPSGFASAIAASGIAMAVPQLSLPGMQQAINGTKQSPSRKTSSGSPFSASSASLVSPSVKRPQRVSSSSSKKSHSRAPSNSISASINSENNSEIYADDRSYSGLEDSSSNNGTSSDDDSIGMDIGEDIPVTGFAVASHKRNADFHDLFRNIPEGDYLIEDYGCALQREILIQGRLYISENHVCFHSNIFGWVTDLSIPISEVIALEKKMTAFVIPNAIQITTPRSKYTFASLLARDTTFDVIFNVWRLGRPEDSASILGSATGSARGSLDEGGRVGMDEVRVAPLRGPDGTAKDATLLHKATQCACGRTGGHLSETALDTVLPGTPDRIHNLVFASGFMKDFMKDDQKLLDIQISDWAPKAENSKLLVRNMSYIRPLSGSIGPKQTKCEIRDETVHCDFEDYVVMLTTTRTPDVPSGGVFSVKTRTCIMWDSGISTRIIVTTQVEWTGRSFIKGIIEKSAIEGQKTYHADLDHAMRTYIQQHQSEFFPEGVDPAALPVAADIAAVAVATSAILEPLMHPKPGEGPLELDERKQRERERNQRGLQWAWDTFEGASQVARQSTTGALELIKETWEQSTSTTICIVIIIFLVFSNLWTLIRMGNREEVGRRKELQRMEEREKWVQGIVTALWDEMSAGKSIPVVPGVPDGSTLPAIEVHSAPPNINWREEVTGLQKTLDAVEERVRLIRGTLNSLD